MRISFVPLAFVLMKRSPSMEGVSQMKTCERSGAFDLTSKFLMNKLIVTWGISDLVAFLWPMQDGIQMVKPFDFIKSNYL